MMDPIVTAALVGTGQRPAGDTPTTPEVDALVAGLPEAQPEPALLLQAGAWAVYKLAGATAEVGVEVPAPAPEERLQPCSPAAAELLSRMFSGQYAELLPEACERMRRAGLRLPHHLLPPALAIRDKDTREALVPLLGERGRWLARFNKAWSWVNGTLADGAGTLPDDAETLWQEGTPGQRVEVLRRLRAIDPARAREWLADAWKREKADLRADLLATLVVGLSAEDEPLLESALDDRADRVRGVAREMLRNLPGSALAARVRSRAEAVLVYENGKIDARPPTEVGTDWARDGLPQKPPAVAGEEAFRLTWALEGVPPSHWERRFGGEPAKIIMAAFRSPWWGAMLEGWANAAVRFGDARWAKPLYDHWHEARQKEIKQAIAPRESHLRALLPLAPSADRDGLILEALKAPAGEPIELHDLLDALPAPWSDTVSDGYLAHLRAFAASLSEKAMNASPWDATLDVAARALPPSCFASALEPVETPDFKTNWYLNNFRRQLDTFADVVRTRRRIYEEISL